MQNTNIDSSFDSLLDTMTNAVGILIIVLAVAHLTLQDNLNRVEKMDPLQEKSIVEEQQQMQTDLNHLEKLVDVKGAQWKSSQRNAQYSAAMLEQINQRMNTKEQTIVREDWTATRIQELANTIEKNQRIRQDLENEVQSMRQHIERSQQDIHLQRDIPEPKVTIARVPDPIPAPVGYHRLTFFCRHGRVFYFPEQKMRQLLNKGLQKALGLFSPHATVDISDYQKAIDYFNHNDLSLNGLRWRLKTIQLVDQNNMTRRELIAYLEWSEGMKGDTLNDLRKKGSKFHTILEDFKDKKVYIKYHVWNDSFPEYVVARDASDEYELPCRLGRPRTR